MFKHLFPVISSSWGNDDSLTGTPYTTKNTAFLNVHTTDVLVHHHLFAVRVYLFHYAEVFFMTQGGKPRIK